MIFPSVAFRRRFKECLGSLNTQVVSRPPMDPMLRKELVEEFNSETESLNQLLQRDLKEWLSDSSCSESGS